MKMSYTLLVGLFVIFVVACSSGENDTSGNGDNDFHPQEDTDNGQLIIGDQDNNTPDSENDSEIPDNDAVGKDTDGDGIPDDVEKPHGVPVDTDDDGTPDYQDTDSDGDGIPDQTEGTVDTDDDGTPNYRDIDSDDDNIPDQAEGTVDSDGDSTPDYLDSDSDGDTIPDLQEGVKDSDGDGMPNYLDVDSDNDTIPDKDEAGPGDPPQDSDDDGYPDFVDLDSDNDGLKDETEHDIGTDPTKTDTDSDGFDDNTEHTAGSNPLVSDPEFYEGQFYVILPYNDPEKNDTLTFFTEIKKADIVITFDLSSTMSQAIDTIKSDIQSVIIPGIQATLKDPAIGIASFSNIEGSPFFMDQPVTKDFGKLTTAMNNMHEEGNGKIESQYEALYQTVTDKGMDAELLKFDSSDCFDHPIQCAVNVDSYYKHYRDVQIPIPNCSGQLGHIGYGCFRDAALPVLILMTDEKFYDINDDIISDAGITAYRFKWNDSKPDQGHYETETIAAMNAINAKIIGIIGDNLTSELTDSIQHDFEGLANGTGSKSVSGDYFIFQVGYSGSGLSNELVDAIQDLLENIRLDITTKTESVANSYGVADTTQFISAIVPKSSTPPNSYSHKDGTMFYEVKPGVHISFDVTFRNTIYENTDTESKLFLAKIHVFGEGAYLDTRNVYIIVPGKKDNGGLDH